MDYYHELIQKIGHPERYKTILGAAVASVTTLYLLKRVISGMSKKKSDEFKGIPVPKGEYFYLGKYIYKKIWINLLMMVNNRTCAIIRQKTRRGYYQMAPRVWSNH